MDDFLTEKQIERINRIRAERATKMVMGSKPPETRFGESIGRSAARDVLTNPDLLKQIGSFSNPKADGFLVYIPGGIVGAREMIEIGNSLNEIRPSKKKSLFIGRYKPLTSSGPFRGRTIELFWPNINAKNDTERLEQKVILDFSFPGRSINQDIFTRPSKKERIFFLPLNVLLKTQHPYGYIDEKEIDKIKKQAYFNNLDYPVLNEEKLLDIIK